MSEILNCSRAPAPFERIGIAALTRAAMGGEDMSPLTHALRNQLLFDPNNAAVMMDLSVIDQLHCKPESGMKLQSIALQLCQVYRTASKTPKTIRLLALAAPIQMGANTPIEFLIEQSQISLQTLYISPNLPLPSPLPEHDLAFVIAPPDSSDSRRFLDEIERHLPSWPVPVLNAPSDIRKLERDRIGAVLAGIPNVILPATARCARADLAALGRDQMQLGDILQGARYPVIVRPVGAHAGRNLEKLASAGDVAPYLEGCSEEHFFVSQFVDYSGADGQFRKYRIVFVDGRPYPCHMAITDQWKVWYMNAGMEESAEKRAEEERFMTQFQDDFGGRHASALSDVARAFGLDYFGIDCAEDREGNLIVFEADNALIVHDMDPPDIFPYKAPQMHKLFADVAQMIARAAQPCAVDRHLTKNGPRA